MSKRVQNKHERKQVPAHRASEKADRAKKLQARMKDKKLMRAILQADKQEYEQEE